MVAVLWRSTPCEQSRHQIHPRRSTLVRTCNRVLSSKIGQCSRPQLIYRPYCRDLRTIKREKHWMRPKMASTSTCTHIPTPKCTDLLTHNLKWISIGSKRQHSYFSSKETQYAWLSVLPKQLLIVHILPRSFFSYLSPAAYIVRPPFFLLLSAFSLLALWCNGQLLTPSPGTPPRSSTTWRLVPLAGSPVPSMNPSKPYNGHPSTHWWLNPYLSKSIGSHSLGFSLYSPSRSFLSLLINLN